MSEKSVTMGSLKKEDKAISGYGSFDGSDDVSDSEKVQKPKGKETSRLQKKAI